MSESGNRHTTGNGAGGATAKNTILRADEMMAIRSE